MKKIDRLILKSFLGPLVLTFTIAVFVLLMQFIWKYIDDMVGKGLEFSVIAELLLYASATFVPMALPIAVLFASIMTMGNFGEKYELVAMKAGGISIRRVMMPMAFVALLLTGVAFYFANNVLPIAMLKYRTTLYDITRKKPAVNIRPSEYYSEIEGYVIRANQKDPDDRTLRDIIIFDHTNGMDRTNIVVADHGNLQSTPDDRYLLFTLYDGYTYTEPIDGENFTTRPLTSVGFEEQVLTFDISSFAFNKSDESFLQDNYRMMNVQQLDTSAQRMKKARDERFAEYTANVLEKNRAYQIYVREKGGAGAGEPARIANLNAVSSSQRASILNQARASANLAMSDIKMFGSILSSDSEMINRHYIEWHRKFTLSVACLLLFLIGAPFGSIVRKGGLGMPLVASVGFFVLYYVVGMICEKSVREGAMGSYGMWMSTFVFIPICLMLTVQATTDSKLFDSAVWRSRFRKWFKRSQTVEHAACSEHLPE